MVLDVALVGTGGTVPLPNRWLASVLMRWEGHLILFDCGEGTQISLRALGWGIVGIDLMLISHLHGDHVGGVPGVLLSQANGGRRAPLTIVGPPGTRETIERLRVIARWLPFPLDYLEFEETGELAFGALEVEAAAGDHSVPCLAYRLSVPRRRRFLPDRARMLEVPLEKWRVLQSGESVRMRGRTIRPDDVLGPPRPGVVVGLVTDTRPTERIEELVRGVDLLVSEAMYGDAGQLARAKERKHMTFAEAAGLAQRAGAGRLVLSHFSPSLTDPDAYLVEATREFPETMVGHDHLQVSLQFPPDPP
jgi:ribonuclease Z